MALSSTPTVTPSLPKRSPVNSDQRLPAGVFAGLVTARDFALCYLLSFPWEHCILVTTVTIGNRFSRDFSATAALITFIRVNCLEEALRPPALLAGQVLELVAQN